MAQYNATLRIITPIIIHTGQVYDLWDLMPHPRKQDEMWVLNPSLAYVSLQQQKQLEFDRIVDEMSRLRGDQLMAKMRNLRDMLHSVAIDNDKVVLQKAKALEGFANEINNNPNAQIYKIHKESLTNKPYIPGSSIKGAIRTAILEHLRKRRNLQPRIDFQKDVFRGKVRIRKVHDFEAEILLSKNRFDVREDPFKFIHVSDFIIENTNTIFGSLRVGNKIPLYTEMTPCQLINGIDCFAKGTITVYEEECKKFLRHLNLDQQFFNNVISMFTAPALLGALKNFYEPLLNNKKHPVSNEIKDLMEKYKGNSAVPIRLGRFSQVESKTFKVERTWDKGEARKMNFEGAKTRTYIKGNIGAGWALLTLTNSM